MSRRAIDPGERALWHEAMRDVARHRDGNRATAKKQVIVAQAVLTTVEAKEQTTVVPAKAGTQGNAPLPSLDPGFRGDDGNRRDTLHQPTPGLDRRNALRLKRGQMAIEGRLDLHGMTQDEAHRALTGFVARSHAAGRRMLLIVTGKGTREGSGVLRAAVPRWLAEPAVRGRVLAVTPAMPKDGGGGALYVLLRRER